MRKQWLVASMLLLGDLAALYGGLFLTLILRYGTELARPWEIHKIPFTIIFLVWLLIFFMVGLYEQGSWNARRTVVERILRSMVAASIAAVVLFYLVETFGITPKTNLIIQTLFSLLLIIGWRMLASKILQRTSKTNVLFFGASEEVRSLAELLKANPQLGYEVSGLMTTDESFNKELLLPKFIQEKNINLVVVSQDIHSNKELVDMLYNILPLGVQFLDFPTFYERLTGKIPVSFISEVWFIENLVGKKEGYQFFKRIVDTILVLVLGIVSLILWPFITLGIILSTPHEAFNYKDYRARPGDGPIFFRQKRVGKNGRIFDFIKFRSQRLGSEKMSEVKETANDPRQYPVGKILRAFYLDELPQIINVLKGEMSLIGPRPERPEYVTKLKEAIPFYEVRLLVPPGITGWAQVNMKNDASVEDAPEKLQYDLYYIKNRSLALDITIALKTIAVMLSRAGR